MARLLEETYPRDLLSLLCIGPDLLLFGTVCYGVLVTGQTGCDLWNPGKSLLLDELMTGGTLQAVLNMFLVIEDDGLPENGFQESWEEGEPGEKKEEKT